MPKQLEQPNHPEHARGRSAAWKIDTLDKLVAEVARDPDGVLSMIRELKSTYLQPLEQANDYDNQLAKVPGMVLGIGRELEEKRTESQKLRGQLDVERIKLANCEETISLLQSSLSEANSAQPFSSTERPSLEIQRELEEKQTEAFQLLAQCDVTQIRLILCERAIESLQGNLSTKTDQLFSPTERQTSQQPRPFFTYTFTPETENQDDDTSILILRRPLSNAFPPPPLPQ